MKRLFFILIAALMTASVWAEVSIPQNIYGLSLGKSTKKEVDRILTAKGMEFFQEKSDSTNIAYKGACLHEGMEFDYIVTRYIDDVLILVGLSGACDSACADYGKAFIKNIHSRYNNLQLADSSFYYSSLTNAADSLGLTKWGRTDGNTLVATMNNDSICMCIYFSEDYMLSYMIKSLAEYLKEADPNYDEKNKVTSIAGVRFGETRTKTINAFKQRGSFLKNEDKITYFSDVNFGGSTYNIVKLYFQFDFRQYDNVLAAAKFEKNFYEWRKDEALMMYKAVVNTYKSKYTNCIELKDEEDSKITFCGMLDDNYDEGKIPPIAISFELGISRGGEKFYYVTVSYFEDRMNSAAADDI